MKQISLLSPLLASTIMVGSALLATGCQADGDDVTPDDARESELATMQGTIIEIAPSQAMEPEQLEAVAKWLEGKSKAHMVKVRMTKDEASELGRLEVEIWGEQGLPHGLDAELRAAFPTLENAEITLANLDGPPSQGEGEVELAVTHDASVKGEDPEALEARIIEEMRAKGVQGDIVVDVVDGPEGERRVEVKVEEKRDAAPE